jgi:NAD(P)H-flavin reductase
VALLYGARRPEDILFRKELEHWRSHFDLQVRITVDQAKGKWYGTVGVVPILIPKIRFNVSNAVAFVCGPEIMMHFTVLELLKCGMKTKDIYISMERNMKCAVGFCGHCQYGPHFTCKDGPVFNFRKIEGLFRTREI